MQNDFCALTVCAAAEPFLWRTGVRRYLNSEP